MAVEGQFYDMNLNSKRGTKNAQAAFSFTIQYVYIITIAFPLAHKMIF